MDSGKIEIKRGDVYWVRMDDGVGREEAGKRPIVVVSSNRGNESSNTIIGAFVTSKSRWGVINPKVESIGRGSWVLCNQLRALDKERILGYVCSLNEEEMAAVDKGLLIAMDLTPEEYDKEADEEEKCSLREEIDSLRTQLSRKKDVGVEVTVERDMYKRMYEKALEMLAAAKMETPKVVETVAVDAVAAVEEEETPKVEINTCTEEELRSVGCTPTMIHYIIENRPYKSVEDIKKVPMVTRVAYKLLENRIFCIPIIEKKPPKKEAAPKETVKEAKAPRKYKKVVIDPNKKVNMNTATVEELENVLGLNSQTAREIVRSRQLLGNFEKIEDVTRCSRFGPMCLKKYGPMMEV